MEYGYEALTVTFAPWSQVEETFTMSFVWSSPEAAVRVLLTAAPTGSATERPTVAWREPARTASVSVT